MADGCRQLLRESWSKYILKYFKEVFGESIKITFNDLKKDNITKIKQAETKIDVEELLQTPMIKKTVELFQPNSPITIRKRQEDES